MVASTDPEESLVTPSPALQAVGPASTPASDAIARQAAQWERDVEAWSAVARHKANPFGEETDFERAARYDYENRIGKIAKDLEYFDFSVPYTIDDQGKIVQGVRPAVPFDYEPREPPAVPGWDLPRDAGGWRI